MPQRSLSPYLSLSEKHHNHMRAVSVQPLEDCIEQFRFEDYTFRLLMQYLLPEHMKLFNSNYDVPTVMHYCDHPRTHKGAYTVEQLEEQLRANPILVEFFGADVLASADLRKLLEPFKQHILPIYTVYADIYGSISALRSGRIGSRSFSCKRADTAGTSTATTRHAKEMRSSSASGKLSTAHYTNCTLRREHTRALPSPYWMVAQRMRGALVARRST